MKSAEFLAPLFEKALVQTSAIGKGDLTVVFESPIALGVLVIATARVALPKLVGTFRLRSQRERAEVDAG